MKKPISMKKYLGLPKHIQNDFDLLCVMANDPTRIRNIKPLRWYLSLKAVKFISDGTLLNIIEKYPR